MKYFGSIRKLCVAETGFFYFSGSERVEVSSVGDGR